MVERASRHDVLAMAYGQCQRCGAKHPDTTVRTVEYREKGSGRHKEQVYRITFQCLSRTHHAWEPGREFTVEVPFDQYWATLTR